MKDILEVQVNYKKSTAQFACTVGLLGLVKPSCLHGYLETGLKTESLEIYLNILSTLLLFA